jgi:short-subunit dehydrogenase
MTWPYEVAAITGASSGIGREMAREIARRGTKVALLARRLPMIEELAAEIRDAGGVAFPVACDVREKDTVTRAIGLATRELGSVDLLVANAGVGYPVLAHRFDAVAAEEIHRVNVFGVLYSIEAVLPAMIDRGRGHIVGLSSLASIRGFAESGTYCASKAALDVQLEGLRVELAPRGIKVTTIRPGFVRTAMTAKNTFEMPFLLEPDDAARRTVRAIERGRRVYSFPWPAAAFMWIVKQVPNAVFDRMSRPVGPRSAA